MVCQNLERCAAVATGSPMSVYPLCLPVGRTSHEHIAELSLCPAFDDDLTFLSTTEGRKEGRGNFGSVEAMGDDLRN